jgi:hypothetical protein
MALLFPAAKTKSLVFEKLTEVMGDCISKLAVACDVRRSQI